VQSPSKSEVVHGEDVVVGISGSDDEGERESPIGGKGIDSPLLNRPADAGSATNPDIERGSSTSVEELNVKNPGVRGRIVSAARAVVPRCLDDHNGRSRAS
jgi:hypothetical protein